MNVDQGPFDEGLARNSSSSEEFQDLVPSSPIAQPRSEAFEGASSIEESTVSFAAEILAELLKPDSSKELALRLLDQIADHLTKDYAIHFQFGPDGTAHPHAFVAHQLIQDMDYLTALRDVVQAASMDAPEVNFHIPYEVQFEQYRDFVTANKFMDFVDGLGEIFDIPVTWENSMLVDVGQGFKLKQQADLFPSDRLLCLDTGHLILGSRDKEEARQRVSDFLDEFGEQTWLVHFHYNDLVHDLHICEPHDVIDFFGEELSKRIMGGRQVLFERGGGARGPAITKRVS